MQSKTGLNQNECEIFRFFSSFPISINVSSRLNKIAKSLTSILRTSCITHVAENLSSKMAEGANVSSSDCSYQNKTIKQLSYAFNSKKEMGYLVR